MIDEHLNVCKGVDNDYYGVNVNGLGLAGIIWNWELDC